MTTNSVVDALLGVAVGDALGVPYEFKSSKEMSSHPAKDMIGYGTYNQPAGTWSDDSSLTLCLAESLLGNYSLTDMASKFIDWKAKSYWSARGEVFDIGRTTSVAIERLRDILDTDTEMLKTLKYEGTEYDNGNGSLMRILPLLFHIKGMALEAQFDCIWEVSALTHRHIRAAMSCFIYLRMAEHLLNGKNKDESYELMKTEVREYWINQSFAPKEQQHFERIIQNDIRALKWDELKSGGYVIESLEASIWCFLMENTYERTVLSAVNLGHDTDTTAAITGGLAGIYYTSQKIPEFWLASIARMEDIIDLGNRLHQKYSQNL